MRPSPQSLNPGSAQDAEVERAVALSDHLYQAGLREQAYRWTLLAADAAQAAGGAAETLRLLRRALNLQAEVPAAGVTRFDLLQRIRAVAERGHRGGRGAGGGRGPAYPRRLGTATTARH